MYYYYVIFADAHSRARSTPACPNISALATEPVIVAGAALLVVPEAGEDEVHLDDCDCD